TGSGGAAIPPTPGAVPVPINLQIDIEGATTPGTDDLVVGQFTLGAGPNPVFTGMGTNLPDADFVVQFVGNVTATGVIRVYNNAVVPGAITQFPDITYHNVQYQAILQNANATIDGIANSPRRLNLGPDNYEPNDATLNAAFVGTGSALNAPHEA